MSNNGNFTATINGVGIHDLYQLYNQGKQETGKKLNDRQVIVDEVLKKGDFFEEYFENIFDPVINNDEKLATDGNVCLLLERLGDYLIRSESDMDVYYDNIVNTREQLETKTNRESSFTDNETNVLDNSNSTLSKGFIAKEGQKVEDIKSDNSTIIEYQQLLKKIQKDIKNKKGNRMKLSLDVCRIRQDIRYMLSKDVVEDLKNSNVITYVNKYDINFTDSKQVEGLLFVDVSLEQSEDLWLAKESILEDLNNINFYLEHKEVVELIKQSYTKKEIRMELGLDNHQIDVIINDIVQAIIANEIKRGAKRDQGM
jgi:hypothetical protein